MVQADCEVPTDCKVTAECKVTADCEVPTDCKKERRGPWKGPRLICDKPFAAAAVANGEVEAPAAFKSASTSRFAAEVLKQVATGNRASYRTLRGSAVKL